MKLPRVTLRDLFYLMLIVAVGLGLIVERRQRRAEQQKITDELNQRGIPTPGSSNR